MTPVLEIDEGRAGFIGIHGGYLGACALAAMAELVERERSPRSLTLTLPAPVVAGMLEISPVAERSGATLSAASARLLQTGRVIGTSSAMFARPVPGPRRVDPAMPAVPPPHACAPLGETPVPGSEGLGIEVRPATPPLPLSGSSKARLVAWMRATSGRPIDAQVAVVLADGIAPALFASLDTFVAIPTVELVIQFADFASAATSPWVLGVVNHLHAADGYTVEDIELWTPAGALVLTARQLRRVLDWPEAATDGPEDCG